MVTKNSEKVEAIKEEVRFPQPGTPSGHLYPDTGLSDCCPVADASTYTPSVIGLLPTCHRMLWASLFPLLLLVGCQEGEVPAQADATPPPPAEATSPSPTERQTPSPAVPVDAPEDWFLLQSGLTWTYEIRQHTGSGPRFLFIPTEPAREEQLGTWTLHIGDLGENQRFPASLVRVPKDGLRATSEFDLWMDEGELWLDDGSGAKPAFVFTRPPSPISSERVPCVANILNGIPGRCAPVWGGPLNTAPGLQMGVVGTQIREGADAAQFMVAVATGGLIIPGNKSKKTLARLSNWEGGPDRSASPVYSSWRGRTGLITEDVHGEIQQLLKQHQVQLDAESAGALVATHTGEGARATALGLLKHLSPEARIPVTRVMLQQQITPQEAWMSLSIAQSFLPSPLEGKVKSSLLDKFSPGSHREVAEFLLDGLCPLTQATLQNTSRTQAKNLVESARSVAIPPSPDDPSCLMRMVTFDKDRAELLDVMLEHAGSELQAELIETSLALFRFDRERLAVLHEHSASLRQLPSTHRERLVSTFTFEGDAARAILELPPEEG